MIHVIQLVLPLCEETTPADHRHEIVEAELTRHFGRVTTHRRSLSEGRWLAGRLGNQNDMVIYEVMSHVLDAQWWDWYQKALEARFCQGEVMIRALPICL